MPVAWAWDPAADESGTQRSSGLASHIGLRTTSVRRTNNGVRRVDRKRPRERRSRIDHRGGSLRRVMSGSRTVGGYSCQKDTFYTEHTRECEPN